MKISKKAFKESLIAYSPYVLLGISAVSGLFCAIRGEGFMRAFGGFLIGSGIVGIVLLWTGRMVIGWWGNEYQSTMNLYLKTSALLKRSNDLNEQLLKMLEEKEVNTPPRGDFDSGFFNPN